MLVNVEIKVQSELKDGAGYLPVDFNKSTPLKPVVLQYGKSLKANDK